MNKNGLLHRTRCYLVGGIESCPTFGAGWRNQLKESLKDTGILFFDPCSKPFIKDIKETESAQKELKSLRENGEFGELCERMREIRIYDLSMVDRADMVIFYFDHEVFTCGSWEEVFTSIRLKRPTFIVCRQGIKNIPLWLFGCLPAKYFYNSLSDLISTIKGIDNGSIPMDSERWKLFREDFR